MSIYLVRHAEAESRRTWERSDDLRPLTAPGRRQAETLVEVLADPAIDMLSSSPSVRCRETLEPLARARRLPIGLHDALDEGAGLADLLDLLCDLGDGSAVLCSHGDVIGNLLAHLESRRVLGDGEAACPKGSTWALEVVRGEVIAARYVPPVRPPEAGSPDRGFTRPRSQSILEP